MRAAREETYGERLARRGITNEYLRAERDGVVFDQVDSFDDPRRMSNWATFLAWEAQVMS